MNKVKVDVWSGILSKCAAQGSSSSVLWCAKNGPAPKPYECGKGMRVRVLAAALFLLALSAVYAAPITVTDVSGRVVTLPDYPRRIVSLSPSVTEILFAVGAGSQVAGVTEYCNYPPETAQKTKIGGFSGATVSVEQIALLKADLVIVSQDMHFKVIPLLERLSLPVFAVEPRSFADIYQTITDLGKLTGHETEAAAVNNGMKEKLQTAARLRQGRQPVTVFWEVYSNPLMTTGGQTVISEAISLAGGRNIFDDVTSSWPQVSVEQVLARRPDWILAPNEQAGNFDAATLARRPGWQTLPAVRQNHVALITADLINRYGPRLADAVLEIARVLFG
ncbi:MAG: cobalamin-binding protein [Spirochaetaceae bacterium]|nr:cobalamin-binding protein [Spirochaetaceae bacterium]